MIARQLNRFELEIGPKEMIPGGAGVVFFHFDSSWISRLVALRLLLLLLFIELVEPRPLEVDIWAGKVTLL